MSSNKKTTEGLESPKPGTSSSAVIPDRAKDLLDLARLRLGQDYAAEGAVKRVMTTAPIRRPTKFQFFRVHPEWAFTTLLLKLKEENESYVVDPSLREHLTTEASPVVLLPVITRQAAVMVWPVRLPRDDGRTDTWARSEMEAANEGKRSWIRVVANMELGGFDVLKAVANIPDPEWPEISFDDLLRLAFRDRLIADANHPVLRRLRGEL